MFLTEKFNIIIVWNRKINHFHATITCSVYVPLSSWKQANMDLEYDSTHILLLTGSPRHHSKQRLGTPRSEQQAL